MTVIIDIVQSFVLKGIIVFTILKVMITLNESLYRQSELSALNELISGPAEVITADLKIAGYNAPTPKTFSKALSQEMQFQADTGSGTAVTIRYFLSSTPEAVTNHRILYRTVGTSTLEIARQVQSFNITYYTYTTTSSSPISGLNVTGIKSIFVQLTLESKSIISSTFTGKSDSLKLKSFWERHFFPQNL